MLRANTGSSHNPDARAAGREAAAKASEGLDQIKVVLVHASGNYYNTLPQLIIGIGEVLPGVPVIGGTAWGGLILPEGLVSGKYFVGLLALADEDLTVGVAAVDNEGDAGQAVEAGRTAALAAMKKAGRNDPPDYVYITSLPGLFEEAYVQGITEIIGPRPMFGVSVGNDQLTADCNVITNAGISDSLAVAFFYTPAPLSSHFTSEPYRQLPERGRAVLITPRRLARAEGLEGQEGFALLSRFADITGIDPDLLTATDLQVGTALDPIGVEDQPGGRTSLRFPIYLYPDGVVGLGANLAEGATIIHMRAEVDDLVAAGGRELEALSRRMSSPAGAYYLAMGVGRGLVIRSDDRLEELAALVRQAAAGVPFLMSFSLAEYGSPAEGQNCCANLMLSYTGFGR